MAAVQYGSSQGQAAAQHIQDNLGGEAEILYINGDANVTLRPRETGFKDALNEGASTWRSTPASRHRPPGVGSDRANLVRGY
jgi:hypothetical protein